MCDRTEVAEVVWEKDDKRVVMVQDTMSDNSPRDADNFGVMWCGNHTRYELGDAEFSKSIPEYDDATRAFEHLCIERNLGWNALVRYLRIFLGATVVKPLWLYDHSGLSISTGRNVFDYGGWDSGIVGAIFDTPRTREYTGVLPENTEEALDEEVKQYDTYLRGEVYGIGIQRRCLEPTCGGWVEDTGIEEFAWGIIGYDYAEKCAKELVTLVEGVTR